MKSPFAIFRTHQKTLMVVLVGLSMIGFVLLGAVPDPSDMPQALVFISVVAAVGGAAWIAGMRSGRSREFGGWGLVLGALIAFLFTLGSGPPVAVSADSGDLTVQDLQQLHTRRQIANQFVYEALRATRPAAELNLLARQYTFGFGDGGDHDVVTTELLRREADRLGLQVTDDNVTEFIRKLTDNRITADSFREIRTRLRIGEPELYEILADELQAQLAAKFLFGFDRDQPYGLAAELPPNEYWEFYRRMHVKQRAEIAAVPVSNFLNESEEPKPEELAALFDKYRANLPLSTPDGQFEEGRPGFMQPRRLHVGYLEAVFDDFRQDIAPVTDADIEQWYQEKYVKPAEAAAQAEAARRKQADAQPSDAQTQPQEGSPADGAAPNPSTEPPSQQPSSDPPAEGAGADQPASEPPSSDSSATEPETEPSAGEVPAEKPASTPSGDESASPENSGSESQSEGQFSVSDGEATAEPGTDAAPGAGETSAESTESAAEETPQPAQTEPATSESSEGSGEPKPDAQPAADAPESGSAPATETPPEEAPAGSIPPPPRPTVPELNDSLREQIRMDIERQRTQEKLKEAIAAAANFFDEKVGYFALLREEDPERITPERASELLKQYASENRLHYAETPLVSSEELRESEDHPIGEAVLADDVTQRSLVDALFQSTPQDRFRPIIAENQLTQSRFVVWKIDERAPYEPTNLQDEQVRAQVVRAWRELRARERAEARAKELAKQVAANSQPMGATLAETTITGREGDEFLSVIETPPFSWLSAPGVPEPNPFQPQPPEIQDPPGVEKAGPEFMRVVFDELKVGETGVAANFDRSTYYVVRIVERTPSEDEPRFEAFRERFLSEPVFEENPLYAQYPALRQFFDPHSVYQRLAVREVVEQQPDWTRTLMTRHNVQFLSREPG